MATVTTAIGSRFSVIDLSQLGTMVVLDTLDSEELISDRMTKFKLVWTEHDPPAGAEYDVENLEFDPIRICQECNAYFEVLLRDRINQAARAVTLAYSISTDLDTIATRFPVGPRLAIVTSPREYEDYPQDYESDSRYRRRTQLSTNATSPHGPAGAYMFWALTADANLRDVSEDSVEGTGKIIVTCMDDLARENDETNEEYAVRLMGEWNPIPSGARLSAIYAYIKANYRKCTTDVLSVVAPKVIDVKYRIRVWFYPPPDQTTLLARLKTNLYTLIEDQRWLGYDHTHMAIFAALKEDGVHRAEIDEPVADVSVKPGECVRVTSIELTYMGRSE